MSKARKSVLDKLSNAAIENFKKSAYPSALIYNRKSIMKIEDLKPGDRLWVMHLEFNNYWLPAVYVSDNMAKTDRGNYHSLAACRYKSRTATLTLWEKLVDLLFKRK